MRYASSPVRAQTHRNSGRRIFEGWLCFTSLFLLLIAGCTPDGPSEQALPTEPLLSLLGQADSVAPLYAMDSPNRLPSRFIIRLKSDVVDVRGVSAQLATNSGGHIYHVFEGLKGFWGELPDEAISQLRRDPNVAYIEADVAIPVSTGEDTTQHNPRWPLDRIDQRALPLDGQYGYSSIGSGVRIWIIDSGVDRNSSELAGRIDESWYVTHQGKDPYAPCDDHGTNVAEVAAGATSGVAKGAIIHSARVDSDCEGHLSTGAASFAFEFIGDYSPRPAVINFSASQECGFFGCGETVDDAATYARDQGVTVVVAAGNSGQNACDFSPAHREELLTVGASDINDGRAVHPEYEWASNWGGCLDLFAPVEPYGGTSWATPMVTGVAALHLQLYPQSSPALVESAVLSKTTAGRLSSIGSGSPNRLLYSKQPPLTASISGPSTLGPYASCSWNADHSGGQPPFQYEWRRDGNPEVLSTLDHYSTPGGETSDFFLELLVIDGVQRTQLATRSVTIDHNNRDRACR